MVELIIEILTYLGLLKSSKSKSDKKQNEK